MLHRLVLAALHVPELVRGCVECSYPDGLAVELVHDGLDSLVNLIDELVLFFVYDIPVRRLSETEDKVLDSEESHAVGAGCRRTLCRLREGYIDLDACRRYYLCRSRGTCADRSACRRLCTALTYGAVEYQTFLAVDGDNLSVL